MGPSLLREGHGLHSGLFSELALVLTSGLDGAGLSSGPRPPPKLLLSAEWSPSRGHLSRQMGWVCGMHSSADLFLARLTDTSLSPSDAPNL